MDRSLYSWSRDKDARSVVVQFLENTSATYQGADTIARSLGEKVTISQTFLFGSSIIRFYTMG